MYVISTGFDIASSIKATLEAILTLKLLLTVYTDSKSLYEYLVKLRTTKEKRLMIDVICLRQAYKQYEISEIK